MICPICSVQMHQKDKLGFGSSTDNIYITTEIKECPQCGRLVEEYYSVSVIDNKGLKAFKKRWLKKVENESNS